MKRVYGMKLLSKGYLVLENASSFDLPKCTTLQLAAVIGSFASLGFELDSDSVKLLSKISEADLRDFYLSSFEIMKIAKGAHVPHVVFYPNFPNIEHISDEEFYVRAILHYLTAGGDSQCFMNQDISDIPHREEIHNEIKEVLHVISKETAEKIIVDIVNASFEQKTAIHFVSHGFLKDAFIDFHDQISPKAIPFRENISSYIAFIYSSNKNKKFGEIATKDNLKFVTTVTDVLRIYAVLSNSSELLLYNIDFKSLDRATRRLFLSILDDIASRNQNVLNDFVRHEFLWKRAFEKLHVGEYKKLYPTIVRIVSDFRNNRYKTFYAKLEEAKSNQTQYLLLLSTRPGEFARRLDSILRNSSYNSDLTLEMFKKIATKVSTTVLMQLWEFFMNRNRYDTRMFSSKRSFSTVYVEKEDNRNPISSELIEKVIHIIEEALMDIYATYPKYENVYISEELKNYAVPRNARNASSQHKTLTYGTRIKLDIEEGSYLRFFTHWKNINEITHVDIDLSLELVDESFSKIQSVSWHNMGGGRHIETFHSGDIIDAPNGASEFIDLNYQKARKQYRYALITNSVYTRQEFASIPECFSGVMFLPKCGKSGEVFQPEFVKYKFDLTQIGSNQNIAFAIDLETLELIWLDCPFYHNRNRIVASGNYGIILALKNALKTHMNMYKFLSLHQKHLTFAKSKEEAEIIFSDSDDATIKPFDFDKIASEWL